jgi:hypothetical protein
MSLTRSGLSVACLFSAMLWASPSRAADLASDDLKGLVGGKMWVTEQVADARTLASFEWKKDGTVCLRLSDTSGKCHDNGTWRIDDARLCWEFTWWAKTSGMISACVSVAELGTGRYEAKTASGTRFLLFTVK